MESLPKDPPNTVRQVNGIIISSSSITVITLCTEIGLLMIVITDYIIRYISHMYKYYYTAILVHTPYTYLYIQMYFGIARSNLSVIPHDTYK